jgi:hypothetical protein
MPSTCSEIDESADGHHSSYEIVTFVFVLWGALRDTSSRQETLGWHRGENYTCTK